MSVRDQGLVVEREDATTDEGRSFLQPDNSSLSRTLILI
jgi:hypothetical protein